MEITRLFNIVTGVLRQTQPRSVFVKESKRKETLKKPVGHLPAQLSLHNQRG